MTMFANLTSPIFSAISLQGTLTTLTSLRLGADFTRLELTMRTPSFLSMFSQRARESSFMAMAESGQVTRGLAISFEDAMTEARAMPPRFSAP